jgi:acyl-coenzyme A thioesterase 9
MLTFTTKRITKLQKFNKYLITVRLNSTVKLNNTSDIKKNTYRVNDNSNFPEDAADATSTVLADAIDFQKRIQAKDRVTWWEILEKKSQRQKEGKEIDSLTMDDVKTSKIVEKTRSDSFSFITLPFKDDLFLRDFYINSPGRLRFGHLFQDLDALAGRVAAKHCSPAEPMNVTASIDRIYVTKKIDEIDKYNFLIVGYVTYTGNSSMEICIKGFAYENNLPKIDTINPSIIETESKKCFLSANFTFVARNPVTHKAHKINKFLPSSEFEWVEYKRAESHNAAKKLRAKTSSLDKVPPTALESKMIHSLYHSSKKLKNLPPNKKPENVFLMKDTRQTATQVQQPQYRNRHGIIFGGYLLRQTFELAYSAAGAFSRSYPRFISLDNTTFKAPVPVGCVLSMSAEVCYTEHIHDPLEDSESSEILSNILNDYDTSANELSVDPREYLSVPGTLVQVQVDTKVSSLSNGSKFIESGTFVYSFYVPRDVDGFDSPGYSSVIPESYSEMMDYVEGRRRAYDTAAYAQQLKLSGELD